MKIYTRTGDEGTTGLFGGQRVAKTHPRVEAYGALDELNAVLGLAAAWTVDADLRARLEVVQARLFTLGADLATPADTAASAWIRRVPPEWTSELEAEMDAMDGELGPLASFILPGGTPTAAGLHLARTVCRRAERASVRARASGEPINDHVLAYLNRLGDWLFVAARLANARADVRETPWQTGG